MSNITKTALDISRGQLAAQKEDLRAVRSLATFSGSISGAIATIFLTVIYGGSQQLAPQSILLLIALALLLGSLACSVHALSNWKECTFDQSAKWIIEHSENGETSEAIERSLALEAEEFFDSNEEVIQGARNTVWWSLVLAWAQAVAWIALLLQAAWR